MYASSPSKEKDEFFEKLHKQILQSPDRIKNYLSDSSNYKTVKNEANITKYIHPNIHTPTNPKFYSSIIENSPSNISFLQSLFSYRIIFLERIFHAKTDGFKSSIFHSKCDKISSTFLLFRTKMTNSIFGGFVSIPWESPSTPKYRKDLKAFLFSFNKRTKHEVYRNEEYSILMDRNLGPCFGGGSDLRINDENKGNCSNLGFTFKFNTSQDYDTIDCKTYLAGDLFFLLEDYEVFCIEFYF